jgi:hypothetical protein
VIDDQNLAPVNSTWHPQIENVVYWGMDWLCPGYSQVLGTQLQKFHGNITAENSIRYITAITQTGDLRICLYICLLIIFLFVSFILSLFLIHIDVVLSDLTNKKMWIAFAAAANETGPVCTLLFSLYLLVNNFLFF